MNDHDQSQLNLGRNLGRSQALGEAASQRLRARRDQYAGTYDHILPGQIEIDRTEKEESESDKELDEVIQRCKKYEAESQDVMVMLDPHKVFDVDKIDYTRYPQFEYRNFLDDLPANEVERIKSVDDLDKPDPEDIIDFARMSEQPGYQYHEIAAYGQELLNDPDELQRERTNFLLSISQDAKLMKNDPVKRREMDYIEQGKTAFLGTHKVSDEELDRLQNLERDNPDEYESALALATSEVRTLACVNAHGSPKQAKTPDMFSLYRYFGLQEKMSQREGWQMSMELADELAGKAYGHTAVTSGKLMSRDYLTYLENISPNGEMEQWDKAARYIGGYSGHVLTEIPRHIDPYKWERQKYLDYVKLYDEAGYNPHKQAKLWRLATKVYAKELKMHNAMLDRQKAYDEANIKRSGFFPKSRLNHYDEKYKVKHHGTDKDLAKLHPEERSGVLPSLASLAGRVKAAFSGKENDGPSY